VDKELGVTFSFTMSVIARRLCAKLAIEQADVADFPR
jgi:hypothetical protein